MKTIKNILLYIWQLPQNLLGLLLVWIYSRKEIDGKPNLIRRIEYKGRKVYIFEKFPGGISCGKYILVDYYRKARHSEYDRMKLSESICHEYGHCRQSKWWGPLYLPVPGLWSVANNIANRIMDALGRSYDYYKCWVEAQADKLGGVKRVVKN